MKKISKSKVLILITSIFFIIGLAGSISAFAATAVDLGTANTFGILAGTGITNTGTTTITGDIGSYSTATIAGFPPGIVIGTNHGGDATTQLAKTDLSTAYGAAAGQPCNTDLTGLDLGGLTLTPGVYCFSTSAQLTGNLILDGGGNPDAIFIFQIGSTLTTASSSSVSFINSAQSRNVFWQVGSSATLGTSTNFKGTILALTSITLTTSATVDGRMLAQNGAVSLDTNTITVPTALHLRKTVTNDNGGTAANTAWTLTATGTGGSPTNLSGTTPVDSGATFKGDTYTLAESGGTSGYTASTYSCVKNGGAPVVSNSITLAAGDDAICTITNNDIAPSLHLRKIVNNTNGGSAVNTAWTLTATGTIGSPTNLSGNTPVDSSGTFKADTYTLAESGGPSGYTASTWVCVGGTQIGSTITVAINESATCTITNSDVAQSLHLRNIVTNDNGGTAVNTAWTLTATGTVGSPTNLSGTTPVDSGATFKADTYTLAESGGPSGYTASSWVCVGGIQSGSTITIASGESATCTITHNDIAPQLHLRKVVNNTHGGTATTADFTLTANGAGANDISGTSPVDSGAGLLADTFALSETGPSGYTASAWVCAGGSQSGSNITVGLNESAICTITNDDVDPVVPPLINVLKVPSPLSLPDGPGSVTYTYTLTNIGTVPVTDVTMVDDSCSPVTFVSGDTNSNSILDLTETWTYHCTMTLSATHTNTVVATGWANGLSATDTASATVVVGIPIVPPLINVTKVPSPLSLPVGGGTIIYTESITNPGTVPLNNVTLIDDKCTPMTYVSGDTNSDSKLDASETWIYTCQTNLFSTTTNIAIASGEANSLTATDTATATVVVAHASSGGGGYSSMPSIIDVVKIPNPLALPKGPGSVTYTYTLRNIGRITMSKISMLDDSCSPMKYISGDTNNDNNLDTTETWTYTCFTTLSATHTNTVVATGWANGMRATDVASTTVVVGKYIVPPLIHVTKVPDPLTLPAGGGKVSYTEEVTNPGTVALDNINLTDDKCSPVGYIFGDTNSNSKLDTNETWTYTCQSNLTNTTTNTAMATGEANGLTARDFAIVTVVVADQVPTLPNTGFPPSGKGVSSNKAILILILILVSSSFIFATKKN